MRDEGKWIAGALAGAGLMYLLDPDRGARRRSLVRDQGIHAKRAFGNTVNRTFRDVRNRAQGAGAKMRSRFRREQMSDEVVRERVHAAIGRAVSHPSTIEITVRNGEVTLQGPVLEHELPRLLRAARRVRGVSGVIDELDVHRDPGRTPGLQGGRQRKSRFELAQENWAPGTRVITGALGVAALYQGLRTRGPLGSAIAAGGAGILARALTNMPAKRLTGIRAGARAIDVQKTINVAAPMSDVWDLWSNYENFPRFMAHVKEVQRSAGGRSHWVAAGPAGSRIEWDAITTAWVPHEVIAWKSVSRSKVKQAGTVKFRENQDGGTQIEVRLSYNPPGGVLGHAVASLFGTDPKHAMDEDMIRLKSLLEEGKTSTDYGRVHREEVSPR